MTFTLSTSLPFDHVQQGDEFVSMQALHEIARAVEDAGFHAGSVTDHPVPSARWLDNGGHHAQDPFVMLSMLGAVTTRLRLQTNIIVLPYRNPFITARAVSSLDHFTGGRVILGMGAGYMKAEYKALGVDFDSRNDLMDEYIKAMKLAWTGEDFTFEGTGYTALGNRVQPTPAQKPHPPLLVGGNSKRALRRTVEHGDAWLDAVLALIGDNLTLLEEHLALGIPSVTMRRPAASYLAWLDFRATDLGDDPGLPILEQGRVGLHHGPAFGTQGAGFARLNTACSPEVLTEAVDRIARVVLG